MVSRGGHGGFSGVSQIITVDCYMAMGTGSAAGACNFWIDVVWLQIAVLLHFCHNRGFVAFGWWVWWVDMAFWLLPDPPRSERFRSISYVNGHIFQYQLKGTLVS